MNNIDLYKLGVNRAGSTYFEGMIDKVMVWESALSDDEITILSRDIYQDCQAYSGSGASGASLEQFVTIDPERDGPEQLKSYLADWHPRIIGMTGECHRPLFSTRRPSRNHCCGREPRRAPPRNDCLAASVLRRLVPQQ